MAATLKDTARGKKGNAVLFLPNLSAPVTLFGYDANGRLRTPDELGPNGGTLRTEYKYDALGRTASVTVPQIGSDSGATATTQYVYDAIGRMVSTTDPLGNETTYTYNPAAHTVTVTEPDPDGTGPKPAGQTISTYDKVGN